MANLPPLPVGTGGDFRIKVQIPIKSIEYRKYLEALKERERLREENGGDTQEGVNLVRVTAKAVDLLAQKTLQVERSN